MFMRITFGQQPSDRPSCVPHGTLARHAGCPASVAVEEGNYPRHEMTAQDPAEVRVARSVVSLSLMIQSEAVATRALVPLISIYLNLLIITDVQSPVNPPSFVG